MLTLRDGTGSRLLTELETLHDLRHPAIVRVVGWSPSSPIGNEHQTFLTAQEATTQSG